MRLLISILVLCSMAHLSYQQAMNCYVPADIMILIDGSDSIQDSDWREMLLFVKNLISQFDVAEDAIHIGMVVYSSTIGDHIALQPFKNKRLLGLFAENLRHPKGSTNTGKGIAYAVEQFKIYGRPNVPKIMIVITDGSSDNPRDTAFQANRAKMQGIRILAVGTGGQQFREELRKIASRIEKVYVKTSFRELTKLVESIRNMVCQAITTTPAIISTPPLPTLPPVVVPVDPNRICNVPGDIIFLLDGSDSISDADFVKLKSFIANMVDNFEISRSAVHIGMIVYSTVVGDTVGLQPPKTKALLKILAKNLRHPKDGTNTARGIERARQMFRDEGRNFAPKLLVVITDGRSTLPRNTLAQATQAKQEGITIIPVGVGSALFSQELNQIATKKVFEVSDFRSLQLIINAMRDLICTAITTTPQFTTPMTPNPIIPTVPPPFGLKCNVPADVGFVLDGSSSILDADWIRVKNFVANLINNLEIGRDTIHAGLVVYSTIIGEVINLTPYKQKQTLIYQTTRLKQPKDGTNTARGISKMRQIMNAQGRPNAPKVMVIITDGRSTVPRNTLQEANNAKADGYTIIAVGVGQEAFTTELTQIATNERKVFAVSDFKELTRIIVEIRDLICQALDSTAAPVTTPVPPITLPPFPGCRIPADIVILTHGSNNINERNWGQSKQFISNLIQNLEVGNTAHHVGFVVYSTSVGDTVGLRPFKTTTELRNYAGSLLHPGAGANTATGLEKLREIFRTQGRADVPRIGLLITDQASTAPALTKIQANLAKKEGLNMLSLGIGSSVGNREVMEIATDARKAFTTSRFDDLQSILRPVRDMICEVITSNVKVDYNYTELCSGCLFEKGTGFNPYPGDCSRYVKCWVDGKNQVMGAIMTCPFGQFWDSQAMACRPSMNVWCPSDGKNQVMGAIMTCPFGQFWDSQAMASRPSMNVWCPSDLCKHAPNGFTYGMPKHGCRSYWVCINGASVGSCCPPGTYYVEGMGCMRGFACNTPCPPDGGLIVSPFCNKEEHWDSRYYIETVPGHGKVVRPCPPGTKFSQNYCMCIISTGLIPIYPGDTCKAAAYYPFDFDLQDKSGQRTSIGNTNVMRTPYGTAQFMGSSRLNLWPYTGVDWNDKLVLRFKFKFDRWGNRYDYGGLIVDMGNGNDWVWDIDAGWTRNSTVGSGWDLRRLLMLFQKLYTAQTEAELERIMIQIANSADFRTMLYQIGFVPESSNAMQILRILVSGEGSILLRQILQQLGRVNGFQDIRLLLQQLLTMQEMERWIIKHGGGVNNTHITLANWRRFLSTLNVTGGSGNIKDWNIDLIDWGTDGRVIADLWRKFVVQMNPTGDDRRNYYTWSFGPSGTLTGNFDRSGLINEMRRALRNKNLVQKWLTFLRNNNIDVASFFKNGGWSTDTNTGYDWLNIIGGGSGTIGGRNIADMWRTFVTEIDVPQNERQSIYTWTFGPGSSGGNVDINGLTEEMKRAITTNSNVRSRWLYFLHRNGIDTSLLRGLGGFTGGTNLGYDWLNWLGGGTGAVGGRNIADLWRSFVRNLRLGSTAKTTIFTWTYGGGTNTDISGLSDEMQRALTDSYIQSLWLVFLRKNNIDVSSLQGNNGWANGYNVGYEWLNYLGGGTGSIGGFSIADLWKNFVLQLNVSPKEKTSIYTWTYGNGGPGDINGLIMEMQNALANSYVRSMWLYYLQMNNIDISSLRVDSSSGTGGQSGFEWLYWLGGGTGNIGGRSIADLWRTFVQQLTLSDQDKMTLFTWTFGNGGNAMDINGLIIEMNNALTNNLIRQLWEQYLLHNNINTNYNQGSTNFGDGWLKILRGSINGIGGTNLGYEWLNWLGGGTGSINGNSIADLWKSFVLQLNLTVADRTNIYTWTFGAGSQGGALDISGLIQEMRLALSNRNIHILWSLFLQGNNIDISSLQGNIGWTAGYNLNYEMLNRIGGGTGTIGMFDIAELWRQFVLQLNVDVNEQTTIYTWTFGNGHTGAGGYVDINGLIIEMRRALTNSFVRAMWLMYLQKHNIDISSLRVITGNDNAFDWLFWLIGNEGDFGGIGDLSGFYKPPMLYAFGKGFGDAYHKAFIHGLMNRFGGFPLGGGSAEVGGGVSGELNNILNNLQGSTVGGAHGSSSSSSSTDYGVGTGSSTGGGVGLRGGILLDEDIFGFDLFRKKRDTSDDKRRKKRQADPRFTYQTLISDCPENGRRPSINIGANERSVKLHLVPQNSANPAEIDLPVVPGWNEVTLVYDGRNMHGMVQNWRGKQHQKVPLNGKIPRSTSGLSVGGCPSSAGFVGQIDDLIAYKCVPQALTSTFGMK